MNRLLGLLVAFLVVTPVYSADSAVKLIKDVTYREVKGEPLQVDLALPAGDAADRGPYPAIICLHGGGWAAGHRRDLAKPSPMFEGKSFIEMLAEEGYVAVTVSYRLAPKWKFPAQVIDCKTAVRWLRTNAEKYHVDPDRIGCVGFSAGGHLCSMLGCVGKDDGLEGDEYPEVSSGVCCVVNFFGPCDIESYKGGPLEPVFLIPWLGGPFKEIPEKYRRASPILYVDKSDAPTLFLHGTKDPLVPINQSERMEAALKKVGVAAKLMVMDGAGHGWGGEQARQSNRETLNFFAEHLKK